ncbi:hypothetical protein Daus18300_004021 [Diaporthe australafricana]|uniref:Uncharacterized protein n=1 Tax=Diaporthe australafricana TaxID=127596 RepID=A0ABR3XBY6_9PEZI
MVLITLVQQQTKANNTRISSSEEKKKKKPKDENTKENLTKELKELFDQETNLEARLASKRIGFSS